MTAEALSLVTNGQGNLKDLMMMNNYKQMGLADSTVKLIEEDLKNQQNQV